MVDSRIRISVCNNKVAFFERARIDNSSNYTETPPLSDTVVIESDDEYNNNLKELPDIKSLREAIEHKQILHMFALYHGHHPGSSHTNRGGDARRTS